MCVCFHVYICVCVCGMMHFCNSCLSHAGCVCDVQTPDCHCRPPVAHCHHVWHSAFAYLPPQWKKGELATLSMGWFHTPSIIHLSERKVRHYLCCTSVRESWGTIYIPPSWEKGEAPSIFHLSERKVRHYLYSTSVRGEALSIFYLSERKVRYYLYSTSEKGEALSIFYLSERKVRHYLYSTSVRERWGTIYILPQWEKGEALSIFYLSERKVRHYLYFISVRERWSTICVSPQWEKGELMMCWQMPVYWCWCVDKCLRIDDNDVLTDVCVLMCQQIQALWTCADTLSSSSSSTLASSHNLSASGASLSSMPSMPDSMHASVWVTHFALICVGQH